MARRRRFRRTRTVRKEMGWTTNFFNSAMDIAGSPPDLSELVAFDPIADVVATNADYNRVFHVKRLIVRGNFSPIFLTTTHASVQSILLVAAYVVDREDADATLVTSGLGDILEGGVARVVYTDCIGCIIQEIPTAQQSDVVIQIPRIDFDLQFPIAIRGNDQMLAIGFQLQSDHTTVLSAASINIITRCLFDAP